MRMMQITFQKDGQEAEIKTNRQIDVWDMFEYGYEPITVKFVEGERRNETELDARKIIEKLN